MRRAEGPIQSFKFDDPKVQCEICGLVGRRPNPRGGNAMMPGRRFKSSGGKERSTIVTPEEYQHLLDRLFDALSGNTDFQVALLASGNEELTHSIGSSIRERPF